MKFRTTSASGGRADADVPGLEKTALCPKQPMRHGGRLGGQPRELTLAESQHGAEAGKTSHEQGIRLRLRHRGRDGHWRYDALGGTVEPTCVGAHARVAGCLNEAASGVVPTRVARRRARDKLGGSPGQSR